METASWVLLIVVSSVLTIFLIVLIVAGVYAINILKQVKRIAEQAEDAVEAVQEAAVNIGQSARPLAAFKLFTKIVKTAYKTGKKR
jgi:hypothetical protein